MRRRGIEGRGKESPRGAPLRRRGSLRRRWIRNRIPLVWSFRIKFYKSRPFLEGLGVLAVRLSSSVGA